MTSPESSSPDTPPANLPTGLGLRELLDQVHEALRHAFPASRREWVRAEVVRVGQLRSGHLSLELAEHDDSGKLLAKADAWLWRNRAEAVQRRFLEATGGELRAGIKILAQAGLSYRPDKNLALIVDDIDPAFTIGDMEARLAAIREKLRADGVLEANRRLPAPAEFCKVAVVSPANAAGLGDFRQGADALAAHGLCAFSYYPAPFQGEQVADGLLAVLRQVYRDHRRECFDAVAIIRGGGGKADLYDLNVHAIANALCRMPLPVLVGVGHERDSTILDEVAWRAFATPSKVLQHIHETIVGNARQARQHYQAVAARSREQLARARLLSDRERQRIHALLHQRLLADRHRLQHWLDEIHGGARNRLREAEGNIRQWYAEILGAGPARALARGYAIVRDDHARPVSRAAGARRADSLELEFHDGRVRVHPKPDDPTP